MVLEEFKVGLAWEYRKGRKGYAESAKSYVPNVASLAHSLRPLRYSYSNK